MFALPGQDTGVSICSCAFAGARVMLRIRWSASPARGISNFRGISRDFTSRSWDRPTVVLGTAARPFTVYGPVRAAVCRIGCRFYVESPGIGLQFEPRHADVS